MPNIKAKNMPCCSVVIIIFRKLLLWSGLVWNWEATTGGSGGGQMVSKNHYFKTSPVQPVSEYKYPCICFSVFHRDIPLIFMDFILRNIYSGT